MTMGFARYSEESGPMEPHQHAEEICVVLSADKGRVRYGPQPENLANSTDLEAGMTLHVPELESHVFEYEPGGFIEIIYFYGQVDNIRPENINQTSYPHKSSLQPPGSGIPAHKPWKPVKS
jgi:hypothetical protein